MCPQCIAGLIGPGDRKSVQPMAARAGKFGYDQVHHFVAAEIGDSTSLGGAAERGRPAAVVKGPTSPTRPPCQMGYLESGIHQVSPPEARYPHPTLQRHAAR